MTPLLCNVFNPRIIVKVLAKNSRLNYNEFKSFDLLFASNKQFKMSKIIILIDQVSKKATILIDQTLETSTDVHLMMKIVFYI